jgi:O-antigen ligase
VTGLRAGRSRLGAVAGRLVLPGGAGRLRLAAATGVELPVRPVRRPAPPRPPARAAVPPAPPAVRPQPRRDPPPRRAGRARHDAVTFLTIQLVLLVGIPATLVFEPLGAAGSPANVFGMLAFGWWALARLVPRLGVARGLQPIRVALVVFAVGILLSYAHAMVRIISNPEISSADRSLLSLLSWAGVALVAADGIRTRERLDTLLRRLTWAAAALAVVGLLQFAIDLDIAAYIRIPGLSVNSAASFIQDRASLRRVAGTASHPIEFGVVLAGTLPIALHYALHDRHRSITARWTPVGLIAVAIMLAISRSAVIATGAALLLMVPVWPGRVRRRMLLAGGVFLAAMRVAVPGLVGTIANLFLLLNSDSSTKARTEDYSAVYGYIHDSPWVGMGFRTFLPSVYDRVLDNQYLSIVVEAGYVGLATTLITLAIVFFTARGIRRRSTDPATRHLGQALAGVLLGMTLSFATFDALSFSMYADFIFLIFGVTGALWRFTVAEEKAGPPVPARAPDAVRLHLPVTVRTRPPAGADEPTVHIGRPTGSDVDDRTIRLRRPERPPAEKTVRPAPAAGTAPGRRPDPTGVAEPTMQIGRPRLDGGRDEALGVRWPERTAYRDVPDDEQA